LRDICLEWGSFSTVVTNADGTVGTHVNRMDLIGCALRICDSVACAFRQQAGIAVNCEVIRINDRLVKLVLSLPNGRISWGNFNVCVGPKDGDPGPVLVIANEPAVTVLPQSLLCWPRTQVGYVPRCVDALGEVIPWVECVEPLRVEDGLLKVRVPRVKPHEFFQLYREPPVLTNPD
jgi:hypothetical protein